MVSSQQGLADNVTRPPGMPMGGASNSSARWRRLGELMKGRAL